MIKMSSKVIDRLKPSCEMKYESWRLISCFDCENYKICRTYFIHFQMVSNIDNGFPFLLKEGIKAVRKEQKRLEKEKKNKRKIKIKRIKGMKYCYTCQRHIKVGRWIAHIESKVHNEQIKKNRRKKK